MNNFFKIGCFALLMGMTACQQKTQPFQSVNAEEFEKIINEKEVQIVDVRTPEEFAEGHIAHSINLNVKSEDFPQLIQNTLHKEAPVAVYCRSGRRSKKAAEELNKAGFTVVELAGGFNEWKEGNRNIEK